MKGTIKIKYKKMHSNEQRFYLYKTMYVYIYIYIYNIEILSSLTLLSWSLSWSRRVATSDMLSSLI